MKFRARLLIMTIAINVIAITSIYVIVKINAFDAVSKIANENARNLLDMAMLSIENQYTSLVYHKEYSLNIRKTERRNIVAIAKSSIIKYHDLYKEGRISESLAKSLALDEINDFRYDNGNGYIWINDTQKPIPRILLHPIYPEYNNRLSTAPIFFTSSDSSNIPRLAVDLCEKEGSGFIQYYWSKPDNLEHNGKIPKTSYVELYEPWQWILGTGVYLEDIENDAKMRLSAIIEELKQTIGNINVGETGYFYIFNGKKEIIMHPLINEESEDSFINSISDKILFDEVMEAEKTDSKTYEYIWNSPVRNSGEYIFDKKVFVNYFEPLDWYVCASIYKDELSKPGVLLTRKILYISAIFLFFSILISIQLSKSIAKPLNNLMRFVSKISSKEKVRISDTPISGSYETVKLGIGIKEMLMSIEEQKNNLLDAKSKIEDSENKYRTLFETSNDAIFLIEGNKIVDCNQKTLELFGCSTDYIIGSSPSKLSPEFQPDGQKTEDKEREILTDVHNGSSRTFEWKHIKQNGEIFDALVSLNFVELENNRCIQAVLRDITQRKKTEKELEEHKNNLEKLVTERTSELEESNEELASVIEELYQQNDIVKKQKEELELTLGKLKDAQSKLIHAEKMASLGVLTAGVAHEINNPLNFISGGCSGLESVLSENNMTHDPRIKVILNSIKTGTDRITSIVRGLNQFSRDKEVYDEDCELHSIIDNCLTILHNQHKNKVEIIKNYASDIPEIKGNVGKLHQAILNIIQNSIHAIPEEGTITIESGVKDNRIVLKITDTGTGISKENIGKITDPFFTTKDPGMGTGLGLSITYSIINEHKGEIDFISEEGNGTTVKIELPIN